MPGPVVNAIERSRRQPSIPTLAKLLWGLGLELRLEAAPPDLPNDVGPAADAQFSENSRRAMSRRVVSEAERDRARRVFNALDLANRIKRAKLHEAARGVR
jgi:hypothetical protein